MDPNEAAAKVLIVEWKAKNLEHELQVTKDESIQLMVRLKKIMDDKISEAKITSWDQREKINVLGAQLQEVEDIVSELRGALRYVQGKCERMSRNDEDVSKHKNVTLKEACDDNGQSQSLLSHPRELEKDSNKEILCLNQRNEYPKCCAQAIQMRNLYGTMPEFPSILLKSKERKEAAVCKNCGTSCQYEVETIDLILKAVKTATNTKHRKKRIASSKKIPDRLFRKLHETPVLVPQSDPAQKSLKNKARPSEGPTPMVPKSPSDMTGTVTHLECAKATKTSGNDKEGDIKRLNFKAAKSPVDVPIVQEGASLQLFKYTYQRKRKRET